MFSFFSMLHLSQFKVGDMVEIITCPRRDGADAYKGYKGVIEDIELQDQFTIGVGSIILKGETSRFIACGIINRLKLKHINQIN
jgi:hypothetical protein